MTYQIHPIDGTEFAPLFEMSDEELAAHGARRVTADSKPGFPCRVSLQDADVGDTVILTNYRHLDMNSPYEASHAVYVRKGVAASEPVVQDVPDMLASRLISVRAFDAEGMMKDADIMDGADLDDALHRFFADPQIDFVDMHFAKRGCFAARATRLDDRQR